MVTLPFKIVHDLSCHPIYQTVYVCGSNHTTCAY